MERPAAAVSLSELTPTDLTSLRLAAQVMSHRALIGGTPAVALYFDSLVTAVDAEQAARSQLGAGDHSQLAPLLLDGARGTEDRRVIGEYLAVLSANERLPASVREICRALQARFRQ